MHLVGVYVTVEIVALVDLAPTVNHWVMSLALTVQHQRTIQVFFSVVVVVFSVFHAFFGAFQRALMCTLISHDKKTIFTLWINKNDPRIIKIQMYTSNLFFILKGTKRCKFTLERRGRVEQIMIIIIFTLL